MRNHAPEHQLPKRQPETGEHVARFRRLAAQPLQKEQVQSSPQEKGEQNTGRVAEDGDELHSQRNHRNQRRRADQQPEIVFDQVPAPTEAIADVHAVIAGHDFRRELLGSQRADFWRRRSRGGGLGRQRLGKFRKIRQ